MSKSMLNVTPRWFVKTSILMLILAGGSVTGEDQPANPTVPIDFANGRDIFVHEWQAGIAGGDQGDGLGPMFNAKSCVACHSQNGVGGSGDLESNAVMLAIRHDQRKGTALSKLKDSAPQFYPGFVSKFRLPAATPSRLFALATQVETWQFNTSLVLHKFSTNPEHAKLLESLSDAMPLAPLLPGSKARFQRHLIDEPVASVSSNSNHSIVMMQRNTPALFGVGLIDTISTFDLQKLAKRQERKGRVTGRPAGIFGWKGQTRSLAEFVSGACANELGLEVSNASQADDPYRPDYEPKGNDLTKAQLRMLTRYVATLPKPRRSREHRHSFIQQGEKVFAAVGCAECHVKSIDARSGLVTDIYSDLLLHDMGRELSDPIGAGLPLSPSGSYYGSNGAGPAVFTENASSFNRSTITPASTTARQEWRTPPLWGVSGSAPYLHDGRAATLSEAILYHGGEAKFAVKQFLLLSPERRSALLEFLRSLVPPEV